MAPNARPDRLEIARRLREIRMLLDLERQNRFKARAYEGAARALERMPEDLGTLVAERRLEEIPGIGPATAATIAELWETGSAAMLDELRAGVRPGIVEMSRIPGMTPRRLGAIAAAGIESLPELAAACESGALRRIPGFGQTTERKILEALRRHEAGGESVLLAQALDTAGALLDHVKGIPGCVAAEAAGAVRRFEELVSEIDVVACFEGVAEPCAAVARFPLAARIEEAEVHRCVLRLADGLRATVSAVPRDAFWAELHRRTGSERHLARLEGLRRARSGFGRGKPAEDGPRPGDETRIYAALGLPYIPPELREDAGEIEAALAGDTFEDLVREDDIRGMVHCHTVFSDGRNTVEQMARAAEEMGMEYITITEHSPSASYAGGLAVDGLRRLWDEIDRVQDSVRIRILRGTESDILADGSLDYPDDVLERLDVVIASVHVRHKMDEDAMTRRIVAAMRQPTFKIWGHALGRLLKRRDPFACRMDEVLDAIAESRAAIEINGDPHRLDLAPRWIREARRRPIRFVVSTDAHSTRDLGNLRFGIGIARKGGVRRSEVLNALDAKAFAAAVRPKAR